MSFSKKFLLSSIAALAFTHTCNAMEEESSNPPVKSAGTVQLNSSASSEFNRPLNISAIPVALSICEDRILKNKELCTEMETSTPFLGKRNWLVEHYKLLQVTHPNKPTNWEHYFSLRNEERINEMIKAFQDAFCVDIRHYEEVKTLLKIKQETTDVNQDIDGDLYHYLAMQHMVGASKQEGYSIRNEQFIESAFFGILIDILYPEGCFPLDSLHSICGEYRDKGSTEYAFNFGNLLLTRAKDLEPWSTHPLIKGRKNYLSFNRVIQEEIKSFRTRYELIDKKRQGTKF